MFSVSILSTVDSCNVQIHSSQDQGIMRSQSTLAASMALLGAASARIVGIAAPSQIAPGVAFPITIITEDYIQTVTDIAAAFGLAQPVTADQCSLGTYLSTTTLGPGKWVRMTIELQELTSG